MQDKKKELHPVNKIKIKKVVLICLTTLTLIFAILYTIELVDKKVNKEEYAKVDEFSKQFSDALSSGQHCLDVYVKIYQMQTEQEYMPSGKKNIDLRGALLSCGIAREKLKGIDIPDVKLQEKKMLMTRLKIDALSAIEISNNSLNTVDQCKAGFEKCHNKAFKYETVFLEKIFYITPLILDLKTKLSVKDILIMKPLVIFIEFKVKKANDTLEYLGKN